jgi:hypothetical protein
MEGKHCNGFEEKEWNLSINAIQSPLLQDNCCYISSLTQHRTRAVTSDSHIFNTPDLTAGVDSCASEQQTTASF